MEKINDDRTKILIKNNVFLAEMGELLTGPLDLHA